MIFLPIVERELRAASRKRSTFWVRVAGALVALVIGSGFLVLTTVGSGFSTVNLGRGLFGALTWLSLAAALSAGLFFTCDCLSEEKREGTLGLLFLTDLRGYDVVFGKLLATSLRSFYALLAVFPILAVTLLMGGVTGAQFWKTSLALVNALFVSLVAGLFVSAISRDSQKVLAGTLLLLLLWVAAGPASDETWASVRQGTFNPLLSLSSPGYLFVKAGAWGRTPFWSSLLVNQAVAWMLLGLTCFLAPRTWQEKATRSSVVSAGWSNRWKFGGTQRRMTVRRKLVGVNPVLWLACRERWQAVGPWVMAVLMGGYVATSAGEEEPMLRITFSYMAGGCILALYLVIASQAGRFFVEAQRSGLLELLLATPLTVPQIVQGQWRALVRMFGMPLALCLAAQMFGTFLAQQAQQQMWSRAATVAPPAAPAVTTATNRMVVTNAPVVATTRIGSARVTVAAGTGFALPNPFMALAVSVAGTMTIIANLAALVWVGMWMGLTSKNASLSLLKTIVFVQIIPWFVISFASTLVVALLLVPSMILKAPTAPSQLVVWYPLLTTAVATVLYLIKDIAFSLWARRKLYSDFRERAARALAPFRPALPSPLPGTSKPPIVASA